MSRVQKAREIAWLTKNYARGGLLPITRPDRYRAMAKQSKRYGTSPATAAALAAIRDPDRVAVADEGGQLTWAELDARSTILAGELLRRAGHEEPQVALMARNSRAFVLTLIAIAKAGGRTLLLNTGFAAPQLADVVAREGADVIVYDAEFAELVSGALEGRQGIIAWPDGPVDTPTVEELSRGSEAHPLPETAGGKVLLLTSGTSGTPKGAERGGGAAGLASVGGFIERVPLRKGDVVAVGAPMFHAWGFAGFTLTAARAGTVVTRRRFDPERTLAMVAEHRADILHLVPVMLERIMGLPAEVRARYDCSSLRAVTLSGSAVRSDAVLAFMDEYGDLVYNSYSSTEVGWASVATPQDLRAAPTTAGRPLHGGRLRILDDRGTELPQGASGRIFVSNDSLFGGYTGGGTKEVIDGFMSTGDVGHLDAEGRLYVDGRDDEMIVSGGENVYPVEVEQCLAAHASVIEVAVIGVDDDEFGQRLAAFVVLAPGSDVTPDELNGHVREHLARYKVPRSIELLDELPRNAAGKVVKRELRHLAGDEPRPVGG